MIHKLGAIVLFVFCASTVTAQQVSPDNSFKIYQELQQLNKPVNVLYLAAHPDDENTRLLSWLSNGAHINTAYLSLTRGDGGQNLLGEEQGASLGLIRTQELLRARATDGASQYFSRAIDFGFSKNKEETFQKWNQELIVRDVVWTIRKFRPSIIICRFPPDTRAGHGQHAASAVVAALAFKAAGDPNKYPEQLRNVSVYKPLRIVFNAFKFGSANTIKEGQIKLSTGQYNPGLGMGYGELAGISRSLHHSQGEGTPSVPGLQTEYFELVDGMPMQASIFDGIDTTWNGLGRKDIGLAIRKVIDGYDFTDPSKSLKSLLALRTKLNTLNDKFWREQKLQELDKIIISASGLMAELYARQPEVIPGSSLPFTLNVIARASLDVKITDLQWQSKRYLVNQPLKPDVLFSIVQPLAIDKATPLTEPYWLQKPSEDMVHYSIPADTLIGLPGKITGPMAKLHITIDGQSFSLDLPLSCKYLDPIKGDVVDPLRVIPPVSLEFTHKLLVKQQNGLNLELRVKTEQEIHGGTLAIKAQDHILYSFAGFNSRAGVDTLLHVFIPNAKLDFTGKPDMTISASITEEGVEYAKTHHLIRYDHIPAVQHFTNAEAKVLQPDWKINTGRIGYIKGAGDYTVEFLNIAGVGVDVLTEADFQNIEKLRKYSVIIAGVRALNVEPNMAKWMPVLMNYVRDGGRLVLQYNKPQGMTVKEFGPFPLTIANLRVTEEDAKVDITDSSSPLLNYPNKITASDFDGWIQERGLYFIGSHSKEYQSMLSMHDTNEAPLDGSLLYAKYGKGDYVYTSLSFFRQLPYGNVGAIRLFFNLLSTPK